MMNEVKVISLVASEDLKNNTICVNVCGNVRQMRYDFDITYPLVLIRQIQKEGGDSDIIKSGEFVRCVSLIVLPEVSWD